MPKEHGQHDMICAAIPPMHDHRARQRHQAVGDASDVHQVGGERKNGTASRMNEL